MLALKVIEKIADKRSINIYAKYYLKVKSRIENRVRGRQTSSIVKSCRLANANDWPL